MQCQAHRQSRTTPERGDSPAYLSQPSISSAKASSQVDRGDIPQELFRRGTDGLSSAILFISGQGWGVGSAAGIWVGNFLINQ